MTGEVEHLNWYDRYIKLRSRAGIEFPGKHSSFLFFKCLSFCWSKMIFVEFQKKFEPEKQKSVMNFSIIFWTNRRSDQSFVWSKYDLGQSILFYFK